MSSKIVLSFANNKGGTVFVHVFRNKLMRSLNYYDENDIYLDNVASRSTGVSGYKLDKREGKGDQGGGYTIGAPNPNWKAMWDAAVDTAKVIILILTQDYTRSQPCKEEFETIKRILSTKRDLRLIILDMGPDDLQQFVPAHLRDDAKCLYLKMQRTDISAQMKRIFQHSFDLTAEGYQLLLDALSNAGVR